MWATQIPVLTERLGLSPSLLGLLLLGLGLGAVGAMMSSGRIIARFGSAALVRAAGASFCLLLPAVAAAPDPITLGALLVLFGASGGSMDVAMNAHAAQVERLARRPFMSSFHGMWSLGGLLGAGLGGPTLTLLSGPLQALGWATLGGAALVWGQARLLPPERGAAADRQPLRPGFGIVMLGLLTALCFSSEGAILDWSSLYLSREMDASEAFAAAGFAAFSGAMAACRFLGDAVRRRIGSRRLLVAGAVLGTAGLLIAAMAPHPGIAIAGFCIAGLGLSNMVPVLFSAAGASAHPDTAIAAVATLGYAGLLAGPPLLGFVADATSIGSIFLVVAGFCALVGLASGSVRVT